TPARARPRARAGRGSGQAVPAGGPLPSASSGASPCGGSCQGPPCRAGVGRSIDLGIVVVGMARRKTPCADPSPGRAEKLAEVPFLLKGNGPVCRSSGILGSAPSPDHARTGADADMEELTRVLPLPLRTGTS